MKINITGKSRRKAEDEIKKWQRSRHTTERRTLTDEKTKKELMQKDPKKNG